MNFPAASQTFFKNARKEEDGQPSFSRAIGQKLIRCWLHREAIERLFPRRARSRMVFPLFESFELTAKFATIPVVEVRRIFSGPERVSQAASTEGAVKSIACLVKTESSIVQQGMNRSPGLVNGSSGSRFVGSFIVGIPAERHINSNSSLILS